ncbi:predicted protein [Chaetomium globosum CBS 148.51]|uniref:Uncharacterized protein n=1 Tax=Chaetomium globosum (strain ATCC 6205 / CBS 148.51 / DSM 1962 / NBRC 6347 / NRRL 1970) TaxID=306901 RepID=Q2GMM3_CHAGB|nr:uncharacterized protein CHGG_10781 [Chaetomium globosum CBS 148.51]EAQ82963.1 predicted protein [Chaetomium globosum CBS 148.51]
MSVVGRRKTADPVSGRMPPMVVSRNAIDPATAPPRAMPRRPERKRRSQRTGKPKSAEWQENVPIRFNPRSLPESRAPAKDEPGKSASELWQYLMKYVPHTTPLLSSPLVLELLPLSRQRGLPHKWRFQLAGGYPAVHTLFAVLVYLCEIKNQLACKTCTGASPSILPFPECITLPVAASAKLKAYFGAAGCCNRFYRCTSSNRNQPYCVSRFSLSSDLGGGAHALPENTVKQAALSPQPDAVDEDGHNDPTHEPDTSTSTFASISTPPSPSPTAAPKYSYSHTYKTAIPVLAAGRPKLVTITKPARPAAARACNQPLHTTTTPATTTNITVDGPSITTAPGVTATTTTITTHANTKTTTTTPVPTAATTTTTTKPGAAAKTTKTKRHSSIRRLAEKLGARAAWREATVYQPRGAWCMKK